MGPSSALAATRQAKVYDGSISPRKINLKRGSVVRWTWLGSDYHQLIFTTLSLVSPAQASGTWTHRFRRKGRFYYYCLTHPNMDGTIRVR